MGVVSEEEGRQLLVLVTVRGYGPFEGKQLFPHFYDSDLPTHAMVGRIFATGAYLAKVRDWLRLPHPREGSIPVNPFSPTYAETA